MTYQEFKKKYDGKFIDVDGQYGAQCWDLGQKYFTECLGLPASVLGGCGLVSNMLYPPKRTQLDKYFNEVSIEDMHEGDVVIWEYGHIAIWDHWVRNTNTNYFFSQNPNPCQVIPIKHDGMHAFRLKDDSPKLPTPVERDTSVNQVEVLIDNLNVRIKPSAKVQSLGFAKKGFYNVIDSAKVEGYLWYKIGEQNWIAYSDEWAKYYPKEETDYKKLYEEALVTIAEKDEEIKVLQIKIDEAIKVLQ